MSISYLSSAGSDVNNRMMEPCCRSCFVLFHSSWWPRMGSNSCAGRNSEPYSSCVPFEVVFKALSMS